MSVLISRKCHNQRENRINTALRACDWNYGFVRRMSAGNITKHLNGTSFNDEKNETVRLSFFQTTLLILFVVSAVILLSSLAYYITKRRAMSKMKHHLVPLYHFDPGECDSWEDELLEDSIKGKPRITHQYYRSVSSSIMTTAQ